MSYIDETGLAKVTTKLKTYIDNKANIPQQIATANEMDSLLIAENVGKVFLYTGTTTEDYIEGDLYVVEQNIPPVDLTGTTWIFNDTVDVSQDFSYSVNYTQLNDPTVYTTISCTSGGLSIGDEGYNDSTGEYLWYASYSKFISITGGTDATNNDLYQYLTNNATQITDTVLTDLDGTTWVFNNVLTGMNTQSTPQAVGSSVDFVSNGTSYDMLWIGADMMVYNVQNADWDEVYTPSNGWANNAYKTIEFTGTVDDADIIVFMYINATKQ